MTWSIDPPTEFGLWWFFSPNRNGGAYCLFLLSPVDGLAFELYGMKLIPRAISNLDGWWCKAEAPRYSEEMIKSFKAGDKK